MLFSPLVTSSEDLAAQVAAHRRGKVPRELRRRQVLAEAHDLFIERGYHGASMDELARRMGVSKPVVYNLASSKEQLFRDVMAQVSQDLAQRVALAVAAEPQVEHKLHAGILAFLRFIQAKGDGWTALLSMEAGPASSEVAAVRREQVQLVAQLIAEGLSSSRKLEPATAQALAHAVNGAVESVAVWWQANPEVSPESLSELLTRLLSPGLLAIAG